MGAIPAMRRAPACSSLAEGRLSAYCFFLKRRGGNYGKRGQETTKEDEKAQTQKAIGPGSS